MWLCFNDCFISIVDKDCRRDELMVRARRPGDIEKLFPDVTVTEYTASDYHYRAAVKRETIARMLVEELARVTYSNFKNSVTDPDLHDAYSRVWSVMAGLQPKRPYSGCHPRSMFDFDVPPKKSRGAKKTSTKKVTK